MESSLKYIISLLALFSAGCSFSPAYSVNSEQTLGRELLDLQRAHRELAITSEEYAEAKVLLIEQRKVPELFKSE